MISKAGLLYEAKQQLYLSESMLPTFTSEVYATHCSYLAEKAHVVSELLFWPCRKWLQVMALSIEPAPGEGKEHKIYNLARRIASFALAFPLGAMSCVAIAPALLLRCLEHIDRPVASLLYTKSCAEKSRYDLELSKEYPLRVRTYNVALAPTSMNTIGDLRDPMQRVAEIIESTLHDIEPPDVIFFQETFHEQASKALCEGIKRAYPYIVHSVLPHISGFSSGAMVASKYRIKHVFFERFDYMEGIENLCPRGILKVCIEGLHGEILLYGVHTQALPGFDRASARRKQLQQIQRQLQHDAMHHPDAAQIIMGDFNTSMISEWGEDNSDQPERAVLEDFSAFLCDLYLKDHDPLTGKRTSGKATRLEYDNRQLEIAALEEPRGSWFHGPLAHKGIILTIWSIYERWKYGMYDALQLVLNTCEWGTERWYTTQTANTARLDYICVPQRQKHVLDGRVEIRRPFLPKGSKSGSSDHLPVDGEIWLKK